ESYRCPEDIVSFSQKLISNDISRIDKPFKAKETQNSNNKPSEKNSVISLKFPKFASEARAISQLILKFMSEDSSLRFNQIAIIMRSFKGYLEIIKSTLDREKIPYHFVDGGETIFKTPIVNAVISLLKSLIIPKNDDKWCDEIKTVLLSNLFRLEPFAL
ncbi:unnamed protein product, partial [marine sediment metagenome]